MSRIAASNIARSSSDETVKLLSLTIDNKFKCSLLVNRLYRKLATCNFQVRKLSILLRGDAHKTNDYLFFQSNIPFSTS